MKPISVEEMLDRIDEVLEESEPSDVDTGVVAAPTGPATPILPSQRVEIGMTTLQSPTSEFRPLTTAENDTIRYTPLPSEPNPFSPDNLNTFLLYDELIEKLEQETEEPLYQAYIEKYTQLTGEPPDPIIDTIIRTRAFLDYTHGRILLNHLCGSVQICPVERAQLDRYGELFEVAREAGESDEAYRERIRQRAFPHLT